MQVSSILLWFDVDHRKELLLALLDYPSFRFLVQFLTHKILDMRQEIFLEEMLNIVFTEDIPLDICVFVSRIDVFKIRWVVFIDELKKAV